MSKKRCRRGHRNRSAVSVTRITVDIGHPNQVNPHQCQSPKLPQNVRFHKTPRSPNHRSRVPNLSQASIAATQLLKHVKTWKNEVINLTKTEQISRISMNGDDWHAQKLFVNVVDSVCVCSAIVLCAQGMDLSRHMVLAGGQAAGDRWRQYRAVRGGAAEGGFGRYNGERINKTFRKYIVLYFNSYYYGCGVRIKNGISWGTLWFQIEEYKRVKNISENLLCRSIFVYMC